MDERKEVIIIVLVLLAIGITLSLITVFYTSFNFNKSELTVKDNIINEKLNYHTNKQYHTLYRNFLSPITYEESYKPSSHDGYVFIYSVNCSDGQAYAKRSGSYMYGRCYVFPEREIRQCPYTEPNEYGCTFGNNYGFKKGQDYQIESTYTINPRTLFKINDKYYIKFVAYSKDNHKLLIKDSNLIINNGISKNYYLPQQDVIIYLHYNPKNISDHIISEKKDFEFDSLPIFNSLFFFLPAVLFYVLWFFTGKELVVTEFPDEMSFYPRERKGWKVAAFFNPPFSSIDKNFFAAIMLDFYRRKIISTKMKGKDVYIKINKTQENLDEVEKNFLSILETVEEKCNEKYRDGDYFNLKKASSSFWIRHTLQSQSKVLQKEVKKQGKDYLSKSGLTIVTVLFIMLAYSGQVFFAISPVYFGFVIISFLIIFIIGMNSSIFVKFKGEYYKEYEHWQAFKKFQKRSSLKLHGHKGVAMWEQHLVYAAALGVAKKVLKELKKKHLITEEQYNLYMGSYVMSHSFATSSGAVSHGGGVGGGGVGGGGGGGR